MWFTHNYTCGSMLGGGGALWPPFNYKIIFIFNGPMNKLMGDLLHQHGSSFPPSYGQVYIYIYRVLGLGFRERERRLP